jgi:hypothetical protein
MTVGERGGMKERRYRESGGGGEMGSMCNGRSRRWMRVRG